MAKNLIDEQMDQPSKVSGKIALERESVSVEAGGDEVAAEKFSNASGETHESDEKQPLEDITIRILVIDDDEQFRRMLKDTLESAGYEVVLACNGAEGLKLFTENPTDLIITDIIMPVKEGLETIVDVKEANPDMKIIAVSGGGWYGSEIEFAMAQMLGARTLKKPFRRKEILTMIKEMLTPADRSAFLSGPDGEPQNDPDRTKPDKLKPGGTQNTRI